jgi:hypothetical protein
LRGRTQRKPPGTSYDLREIGFSDGRIDALVASGAVRERIAE